MEFLPVLISGLLYPGLLTALLFGVIYHWLTAGRLPGFRQWRIALATREGMAAIGGMLLAAFSLAALPWPLHPTATAWWWAWAGFELAFLLPLLPALTAGAPSVVRSAIREVQIGILARMLIWAAAAIALGAADWSLSLLPAHLLALLIALICIPAAIGSGPFAAETSITPQGNTLGLDAAVAAVEAATRLLRAGIFLAAVLVAVLPTQVGPAWSGVLVLIAGWLTATLALRRLAGYWPRLPAPFFLRWGWLIGFPLIAAATLALALGT